MKIATSNMRTGRENWTFYELILHMEKQGICIYLPYRNIGEFMMKSSNMSNGTTT